MVKLEYTVEKPLNREPPIEKLVSSFITGDDGYDRNHGPIPFLDASTHTVRVDGAVNNVLDLSISSLRNDFAQHSVLCALQCAGNRRNTMRTRLKEVQGVNWFDGAVMNCHWRGPRLRDVLNRAGIALSDRERDKAHVAFACYQTLCQDDEWYGASIPLERALRVDADVILALEMNGRELSPKRGFPVRVITPGIAGARAVKWLDRITVQTADSPNYYQQLDYKVLPAEAVDSETAQRFWQTVPAIQDMPINSVIAVPASGSTVSLAPEGKLVARGYALPAGEDGPVTKVEVSGDGGRSWTEAELLSRDEDGFNKWSWMLWKAAVVVEPGIGRRVLSRATDRGGNLQPPCASWNLRGLVYNGYGEALNLTVVKV